MIVLVHCTTCAKWNDKATAVALDLDLYPRPHGPRIVSHCFGLGKGNLHSRKASYCTPQWHNPRSPGAWDWRHAEPMTLASSAQLSEVRQTGELVAVVDAYYIYINHNCSLLSKLEYYSLQVC